MHSGSFEMITFRQLEVLKTLLATGSTIATAKSMGLSQSGVSRLLQQLESDLSLTLFTRDKGRLIPTPEASILARDAEHILLGLNRFSGLAEDLRSGAAGPEVVRIGLPSSMWEEFAPAMLVDYAKNYPTVRIETFFETTTAITRLVEQQVIDFGFLRYEEQIGPGIDMESVASGVSVCVIPESHPLAALAEITPKDLRNIPLILIGRQMPTRMLLDQTFKRAGVKQNIKIETHTNSSACAYVAHGLGVAILSSFYANLYRHLPVVQRPFTPVSRQEFGLAKPAGVPLSLAAQALMDALKRQIALSQKT
jgi:DNA-binding transcriptional LysR family regulator